MPIIMQVRSFVLLVAGLVLAGCAENAGIGTNVAEALTPQQPTLNRAPAFAVAPPATALENQLYSFTAVASDPDGDVMTFDLLAAPAGMNATAAGLIEWTPVTGGAGDYQVVLAAGDGLTTVTLDWTISVQPGLPVLGPDVPALITSAAATEGIMTMPYEYQIAVAGSPAPVVTVSGAPVWLNFDSTTNILAGTPPPPGGTTGTIRITADNGIGSDSQEFSITVKQGPIVAGGWAIDVADGAGTGETGRDASMVLDGNGVAHIVYFWFDGLGSPNNHIRYSTGTLGNWTHRVVDYSIPCPGSLTMALDTAGYVHIAYQSTLEYDLMYVTNASGSWVTEVVDGADMTDIGTMGEYASIAVDGQGKIHIGYMGQGTDLFYACNVSGSWQTQTVDDGGGLGLGAPYYAGYRASIAIDSNDQAHFAYQVFDRINVAYFLRYAAPSAANMWDPNAIGMWNIETVDEEAYGSVEIGPLVRGALPIGTVPLGAIGGSISLALDVTGVPHVAYGESCGLSTSFGGAGAIASLRYATKNNAGIWNVIIVEDGEPAGTGDRGFGFHTSMALDASGRPHIGHMGHVDGQCTLRHAAQSVSGAWITGIVDGGNAGLGMGENVGAFASLDLDASGKPHIAYKNFTPGVADLKYAVMK